MPADISLDYTPRSNVLTPSKRGQLSSPRLHKLVPRCVNCGCRVTYLARIPRRGSFSHPQSRAKRRGNTLIARILINRDRNHPSSPRNRNAFARMTNRANVIVSLLALEPLLILFLKARKLFSSNLSLSLSCSVSNILSPDTREIGFLFFFFLFFFCVLLIEIEGKFKFWSHKQVGHYRGGD